jgi:DNA-binding Lrp family transcriptional regulator
MRERILKLLEEDAKLTAKQIATMLNIDAAAAEAEIEKLEKENVICAYKALINWEKTERSLVKALIELKVTPKADCGFDEIAERIMEFPEVESIYLMSGGYDLAVTVTGKSFQEIAFFVSGKISVLDSVVSTATHFILKKYKDDGIVLNEKIDERGQI